MFVRVYKDLNVDALKENEKPLAFLLTFMFRASGDESQLLTIDEKDLKYIYHQGLTGRILFVEDLNHNSELGNFFQFADMGARWGVRIRPEMIAKRYANRKLAIKKCEITDTRTQKVAVYLHAVINLMDSWFTKDDYNIFSDGPRPKTRIGHDARSYYKSELEVFSVKNMFDD